MITFRNSDILYNVKVSSGKDSEFFESDDLLSVTELVVDSSEYPDGFNDDDLESLKYFKNLTYLKFKNFQVDSNIVVFIQSLKELKELIFYECTFENELDIASFNIESLTLNSCVLREVDFIYEMKYLKSLNLIGGFLDFSKMFGFNFLKTLSIASCIVVKVDEINLPILESFTIDFSNVEDLKFLSKLSSLKRLSLSENQIESNKDTIKLLISQGVDVYENDLMKIEEV